jgi:hypothetical protein
MTTVEVFVVLGLQHRSLPAADCSRRRSRDARAMVPAVPPFHLVRPEKADPKMCCCFLFVVQPSPAPIGYATDQEIGGFGRRRRMD